MHEPKVAEKDTPYWWEAAPLEPLPRQTLPEKLVALETEQKSLLARLADPGIYQDRSVDVKALNLRNEAIEAELTRLLARWEELEARK